MIFAHALLLASLAANSSADPENLQLPGSGQLLYRQELSREHFPAARSRLEGLFAPGKIHAGLGSTKHKQVLRRLDLIATMLESPHPDPSRQHAQLERRLREVNEMLVSGRLSGDSEVGCRKDARTGSRQPRTYCFDREEMEEIAQRDREMLRETKCQLGGARLQYADGRTGDMCR